MEADRIYLTALQDDLLFLLKEIKARITRLYNWSKEQSTQPENKGIMAQLWQARQEVTQPTSYYGKIKALKENAVLFSFLQSNGISSMQELHDKIDTMQTDYYALRGDIRNDERQIATLTAHLDNWTKYEKYKGVHRQLANVKPHKRDDFIQAHHAELTLYDSAVRYLDELKKSGKAIAPKKWRSEVTALTAHKGNLYGQMKSMREDLKTVEQLCKAADHLAEIEKPQKKEQKHER